MSLSVGITGINALRLGPVTIGRAYLGAVLVFDMTTPPPPPPGGDGVILLSAGGAASPDAVLLDSADSLAPAARMRQGTPRGVASADAMLISAAALDRILVSSADELAPQSPLKLTKKG